MFIVECKDAPRAKWKPVAKRWGSRDFEFATLDAALDHARQFDQDGYIDGTYRIRDTTAGVVSRDLYNA